MLQVGRCNSQAFVLSSALPCILRRRAYPRPAAEGLGFDAFCRRWPLAGDVVVASALLPFISFKLLANVDLGKDDDDLRC
ncbi:hypothetical protein OPV22_014135 [Ensete ventricosum]|uniref:Uncharacterized protein n=1 Tax=Ensete ventricosum TaxID=4639 RepID=A0AAV8PJ92_ENSVE|nr:hypothetical protein OPV22_014135 [Ensete ventricosum]